MDFDTITHALDPAVNRVNKSQTKQIQAQKKKKIEAQSKMVSKKEEIGKKTNNSSFSALKEIVNMKKDKAVANELDEVIYNQNERRSERERKSETPINTPIPKHTLIQSYLEQNPEKLKELTVEDVIKLATINNNNGNNGSLPYDPMNTIMMMGLKNNNGNNGGGNDMQTEIMKMVIQDVLNRRNAPIKNEGDGMIKLMMTQMQETNKLVLQLIANKNQPVQPVANPVMKDLLNIVQEDKVIQRNMVMDKLKEIEFRSQGVDQLGEVKRVVEFAKTFGGVFGGNSTPDSMKHELEMKRLDFEQDKQLKEEELKDNRMTQIGDLINRGIGTFAEALSKPTADLMSAKIKEFSEKATNASNKMNFPQKDMNNEIDLGDLNSDIENLNLETPPPSFSPKTRTKRFEVRESGEI